MGSSAPKQTTAAVYCAGHHQQRRGWKPADGCWQCEEQRADEDPIDYRARRRRELGIGPTPDELVMVTGDGQRIVARLPRGRQGRRR